MAGGKLNDDTYWLGIGLKKDDKGMVERHPKRIFVGIHDAQRLSLSTRCVQVKLTPVACENDQHKFAGMPIHSFEEEVTLALNTAGIKHRDIGTAIFQLLGHSKQLVFGTNADYKIRDIDYAEAFVRFPSRKAAAEGVWMDFGSV